MSLAEWTDWGQLAASARWVLLMEVCCAVGVLLAFLGARGHFVAARAAAGGGASDAPGSSAGRSPAVVALAAGTAVGLASLWARYVEVNHFPSQTMSEVLTVFCVALLSSLLVLHFALGLHRRGPGWALVDDSMIVIVLLGVLGTVAHLRGLSTAQRDLPPALQSYWFAPHIVALIFSYATLGIAGVICLVYFITRFWSGVLHGGQSRGGQWLILGALTLIPFLHVVTLPVLALSGVVFWVLVRRGSMPDAAGLARLERELDDVSFRAFAVGMPFLTAGLWMGAFWAQEAWANYWGWDSKENSALITWLIYVVYIHLRMLGGYRGAKAMSVLLGGAFSIFITFQVFGYLPDSQKSLHRYTDDEVTPQEGQLGPKPEAQASVER
ncbi:MAG: cytochrome c biogenesis protein CcsA [Planctomycetota bacterium]|jgi:cytochrome c-type biogenesis protein CcsB|nr:cytochrome c biogenesis protein CcsA [Planctomycetota bacterium]MDP6762979.1 cytochrome c biogenesis protein CcsA [Planctomycetota bacterium]MDP6987855.1 cytochrome c biogenesis protein CcsA [Planctomycetota bacterium]